MSRLVISEERRRYAKLAARIDIRELVGEALGREINLSEPVADRAETEEVATWLRIVDRAVDVAIDRLEETLG